MGCPSSSPRVSTEAPHTEDQPPPRPAPPSGVLLGRGLRGGCSPGLLTRGFHSTQGLCWPGRLPAHRVPWALGACPGAVVQPVGGLALWEAELAYALLQSSGPPPQPARSCGSGSVAHTQARPQPGTNEDARGPPHSLLLGASLVVGRQGGAFQGDRVDPGWTHRPRSAGALGTPAGAPLHSAGLLGRSPPSHSPPAGGVAHPGTSASTRAPATPACGEWSL